MSATDTKNLSPVVTWDTSGFFFRSPFRSGRFLIATAICTAAVLFDAYALIRYGAVLSGVTWTTMFFCGLLGAVAPMVRTVRRHEEIYEMYLAEKLTEARRGSELWIALDTASNAMLDGLFYQVTTVFFLLWVLWHYGIHPR